MFKPLWYTTLGYAFIQYYVWNNKECLCPTPWKAGLVEQCQGASLVLFFFSSVPQHLQLCSSLIYLKHHVLYYIYVQSQARRRLHSLSFNQAAVRYCCRFRESQNICDGADFSKVPHRESEDSWCFFYFVLKHSEVLFIKPKHVLIAIVLNPEAGERVGCKRWLVL